jgi:predicted adenylyl cyclase CyaB
MAYDGIEVELKFECSPAQARVVSRLLDDHEGSTRRQVDHYYDHEANSFLDTRPVSEWLSIRERDNSTVINHKRWHFGEFGVATHCDEVDVVVENASAADRLLRELGYKPLVTVDKVRRQAVVDSVFMVAFDTVEGLGHYVEVEAAEPLGDVEATRRALLQFATTILQMTHASIDNLGYPQLLLIRLGRLS